jgi:hypothetical protein
MTFEASTCSAQRQRAIDVSDVVCLLDSVTADRFPTTSLPFAESLATMPAAFGVWPSAQACSGFLPFFFPLVAGTVLRTGLSRYCPVRYRADQWRARISEFSASRPGTRRTITFSREVAGQDTIPGIGRPVPVL